MDKIRFICKFADEIQGIPEPTISTISIKNIINEKKEEKK